MKEDMQPQDTPRFKCYMIGGSTLSISCCKILLQQGFEIAGLYSQYPKTVSWATQTQIPVYTDFQAFEKQLTNDSYDYLFSIINPRKLCAALLASANIAAINYHDSLLPRYAGCNATTWAILHNEATHGVTWHVMDEIIDNGPILNQVSIPISKDETALSLNLKCYQAAIRSFAPLAKQLLNPSSIPQPKKVTHPKQRHYFSKSRKPDNEGIINWQHAIMDIERLYRALYYGEYDNPITHCKVQIPTIGPLIPYHLNAIDSDACAPAGSILSVNEHTIEVAGIDGRINVGDFRDHTNQKIPISHLLEKGHIKPQMVLP